jgi:hypothetical protein
VLFDRFTLKFRSPEIHNIPPFPSMSVIRCVIRLILIVLQWTHCKVRKAS